MRWEPLVGDGFTHSEKEVIWSITRNNILYLIAGLEFFSPSYVLSEIMQNLFETAADWFKSGSGFLGEMDYKAAWNVRFPGVIVFVEKHFLVSLQDLSLDILHLPDSSVVFIQPVNPCVSVCRHLNEAYCQPRIIWPWTCMFTLMYCAWSC